MISVVLDTNIVVSAFLNPSGNEALVLLLCSRGHLSLATSSAILEEYAKVLRRPRLKLRPELVEAVLAEIHGIGRRVEPASTLTISPDESDNRFYECAVAARADFLVTGNARHFPVGVGKTRVVNTRQLLESI